MKIHASEPAKQQNQPSSSQPIIRPKLNVNTPGDAYEQEADATADKVMRMKTPGTPDSAKQPNGRYYDPWRPHVRDPFVTPRGYNRNGEYYDPYRPQDTEPFGPRPKPQAVQRKHHGPDEYLEGEKLSRKEGKEEDEKMLHRKEGKEEDEKMLHRKEGKEEDEKMLHRKEGKEEDEKMLHRKEGKEDDEKMLHRKEGKEEDEKMLHRKEGAGAETQAGGGLDSYVNSLGSSGQPLPDTSREFFEPRFGHDFSGVKIHNDGAAAKSAQSINALAYTTGNNIVFNEGQFAPGSDSGDRLLAHELTHVVQQENNSNKIQTLKKNHGNWQGIIIAEQGAHIRNTMDAKDQSNIIGAIPKGQPVHVISESGNWLEVESSYTGQKVTGFIYENLVSETSTPGQFTEENTGGAWSSAGNAEAALNPAWGPGRYWDQGLLGNAIKINAGSGFSQDLFSHFWAKTGEDYELSTAQFNEIVKIAVPVNKPYPVTLKNGQLGTAQAMSVSSSPEYGKAIGQFTMYYDVNNKAIGLFDTYDFDPHSWFGAGRRSNGGELVTDLVFLAGKMRSAVPFNITYGVRP